MIIKTEAIVLRAIEFKESSLIFSLFTRKEGIVSVIAKGARKPKSKFSAYLVPGQVLEVVFYHKPTRNIQTLSDTSYLLKLDRLRTDIEKMALTTTTMELVGQVLHENEVNEPLFLFITKMLSWLNKREQVSRLIFPYIQLRIIDRIGIGLQAEENLETNSGFRGYINIESGALSNSPEGEQAIALTDKQFSFLSKSLIPGKKTIFEKKLTKNELSDLIEYLDKYIRYHVEGVKPRKSDDIFATILSH